MSRNSRIPKLALSFGLCSSSKKQGSKIFELFFVLAAKH